MRKKMLYYLVLGSIVVLLILFGSPKSNKLAENPPIPIKDEMIENYLNDEIMLPSFGGEIFSSYEAFIYDINKMEIYLWAIVQEYYLDGDLLEMGTGMSGPIVLETEEVGGSVLIEGHKIPRDGAYYKKDIKSLFPQKAQRTILDFPDDLVRELSDELVVKVKENYKHVNEVRVKNIKSNRTVNLIETEAIEVFEEAIKEASLVPGIVNMADPEYKIEIGGETYFLWLDGEKATIMNTKDTHTIYNLSEKAAKAISLILE